LGSFGLEKGRRTCSNSRGRGIHPAPPRKRAPDGGGPGALSWKEKSRFNSSGLAFCFCSRWHKGPRPAALAAESGRAPNSKKAGAALHEEKRPARIFSTMWTRSGTKTRCGRNKISKAWGQARRLMMFVVGTNHGTASCVGALVGVNGRNVKGKFKQRENHSAVSPGWRGIIGAEVAHKPRVGPLPRAPIPPIYIRGGGLKTLDSRYQRGEGGQARRAKKKKKQAEGFPRSERGPRSGQAVQASASTSTEGINPKNSLSRRKKKTAK